RHALDRQRSRRRPSHPPTVLLPTRSMTPRFARFLGSLPTLALAGGLLALTGCTSSRPFVGAEFRNWEAETPPDRSALTHRVFLVGETADEEDAATLWLLREQLEDFAGRVVVIPGDDDARGADALERQAAFFRAHLGDG